MRKMKLSLGKKLPLVFQTEAAECGLACLAMIAGYHGAQIDLPALRQRFSVSLRGATLSHIIRFAGALDLTGRPLRVELEDLAYLKTPCILHWKMDHFVVLRKVTRKYIFIHDPATGPAPHQLRRSKPLFHRRCLGTHAHKQLCRTRRTPPASSA